MGTTHSRSDARANIIRLVVLVTGLVGLGSVPARVFAQSDEPQPVKMQEYRQTGSAEFQIATVSTRNDMVSGGDVLLRIGVSSQLPLERVAVALNGQDVRAAFRAVPGTRTLLGLVTGLRLGDNTLAVTGQGAGAPQTSLVLTNWPIEGPIFSGPHQQPYVCMTQLFDLPVTGGNLGPALDKNCSMATRVDYIYRTTGNEFKPLPNPSARPADLAQTTTNEGKTVAYVVRIETGTVDRGIYQIAVLHDPTTDRPVDPWTRPAGWNGRLIYTFGGGCPGGWFQQGQSTGGVVDDPMLSQGFAVVSSSKNVMGNNCDDLLASETLMMTKERFIERFGPPAHTIGWGCSGGSDQVHQIGDNYPGLLNGIVPACSFPDIPFAHTTTHSFGARLLYNYFQVTSGVKWTRDQQVQVIGFPSYESLVAQATRADRINPRGSCDETIPVALLYDPVKNKSGARCTTYDHGVAVWGRDPATGFARRPLDNVAVQYGLKTLNSGLISKAQFLDLNEKIGGVDIDAGFTKVRSVGDRLAVRRGYESGRFLSGGGGLAETPIIDYRAYADFQPGDPHMRYHGFSTRQRLIDANGNADNHIMLVEDYTYGGFSTRSPLVREALKQMDQWLLNLAKDTSNAPRARKVAGAKPADLRDMCLTPFGKKILETQLYQAGGCNTYFPSHASAYLVAGMPVANNIVVCQHKPVDPTDYMVQFTPAEIERLRRIFPDGVCDYSKAGIEQRPLLGTWLSFGPAGKRPTKPASD
ncbi:MAG: hypothetical protein EXR93_07300 [Gemmatimonadetes bacterium]|nr:hypothetical protein [Gemmatimonadota bacterium]